MRYANSSIISVSYDVCNAVTVSTLRRGASENETEAIADALAEAIVNFEERAAILEVMEGLPRSVAETKAWRELGFAAAERVE